MVLPIVIIVHKPPTINDENYNSDGEYVNGKRNSSSKVGGMNHKTVWEEYKALHSYNIDAIESLVPERKEVVIVQYFFL